MDSNEHGAMEQNEEHHGTTISIYYTRKTELYAESYDAMNMSRYCKYLQTWRNSGEGESQPSGLTGSGSGPSSRPRLPEFLPEGEEGEGGRPEGEGVGIGEEAPDGERGAGARGRRRAAGGGAVGRGGRTRAPRAAAYGRRRAATWQAPVGCGWFVRRRADTSVGGSFVRRRGGNEVRV